MTVGQYAAAPATLTVRELRVGGKTQVTTLLCPQQVSKAELKQLYEQRWHAELDLRSLKTTMGMEMLSCKSPAMAIKEIWVHLLAYNLIRRMIAQAACVSGVLPRLLSFKHAMQLCLAWRNHAAAGAAYTHPLPLLLLIAQRRVGRRPGRIEPRAVKRRPKPFPLLVQPRHRARAEGLHFGHARP